MLRRPQKGYTLDLGLVSTGRIFPTILHRSRSPQVVRSIAATLPKFPRHCHGLDRYCSTSGIGPLPSGQEAPNVRSVKRRFLLPVTGYRD